MVPKYLNGKHPCRIPKLAQIVDRKLHPAHLKKEIADLAKLTDKPVSLVNLQKPYVRRWHYADSQCEMYVRGFVLHI